MKFSVSLAFVALATSASAHIRMFSPLPYGGLNPNDLAPLEPDGSDFPCKVPSSQFVFPPDAPALSVGANKVVLQGSAVHGGGSCQVSITYDTKPNANSVFRVLKTFEGGCPTTAGGNLGGSADHVLDYQIPPEVASGEAVLVWTWFNNIGNREMYMRCAPVKINSGHSDKGKLNNDAKFPIMFRANIGAKGNSCSTPQNTDLIFPQPGAFKAGSGTANPTGCAGGPPPSAPPPKEEEGEAKPPPAENNLDGPGSTDPAKPIVEKPVEKEKPAAPITPKPTPVVPPVDDEKETPEEDKDEQEIVVPVVPVPETPAPVRNDGGECPVNGAIICNGEGGFFVCNWGKKVDMGRVAAGTVCTNGKIQKRNMVRFSSAHLRRRHHHGLAKL